MSRTAEERFWSHVQKSEGCWLWTGADNGHGYGVFGPTKGVTTTAHRYSAKIAGIEIPDGLHVCHHCDVRRCVRPDHLFVGTALDNQHDSIRKGRKTDPPLRMGSAHGRSKLQESDVADIRERVRRGSVTQAQLAREYGVSRSSVSMIVRGKIWSHVCL